MIDLSVTVRSAEPRDVVAITEIYNEAIRTTTATFDVEEKSVAERARWLESHGERHPVLVAEADGEVVGWASLSRWSERPAYDGTAETSFYVRASVRGRGVGTALAEGLIAAARRLGYHTLLARIAAGSDASVRLHRRAGFVHVGTLQEVGRKFGRLLDVHVMQKMLNRP